VLAIAGIYVLDGTASPRKAYSSRGVDS
jgi:hypothetical protein